MKSRREGAILRGGRVAEACATTARGDGRHRSAAGARAPTATRSTRVAAPPPAGRHRRDHRDAVATTITRTQADMAAARAKMIARRFGGKDVSKTGGKK